MTKSQRHPDNILWLDFETTGLMSDPDTVPLEVAAIITDGNLNELASFDSTVIDAKGDSFAHALSTMGEFVRNMHSKTGLLDRIADGQAQPLAEVDRNLASLAAPYFPAKGEILEDGTKYRGMVIGGNSVKFDFDVIEKFFPATRANMDYRVIDISGVGELVRRWNRPAWEAMPAKASDHTAMTDIREGIKELRYYRDTGLIPTAAAL